VDARHLRQLFPLMKSGMRITRLEGALLLGVFIAYTAMLIASI